MSTTLSAPDPGAQLDEIRQIITNAEDENPRCEQTLLAIRRVVFPPPAAPLNPPGGWPVLRPSDGSPGTAWERHDDPRA